MRKILSLILIAAMAIIMCSCTKQSQPESAKTASEESALTIGMSFDSFVIERWTRDRDVFVSSANDLGAEVNVQSANGEVETQIAQIKYFIDKHVDAIVIITVDSDALTGAIKEARNAGIPVVCYDRVVRNCDASLYISFDNDAVGRQMGEAICRKIGDGGKIVEVCGPKSDYNVEQVMSGFEQVLKLHNENVLMSCNCDEWKPEAAYDFINSNISVIEEADAIMCGNDALAGEVLHALAERGLSKKIYCVGQDADLEACQRIVEGTQLMTVYKPVEKLAAMAAEYTVKLANHKELTDSATFNDGKYDIPYIAIDPVPVYQENMDRVIIDGGFHLREEVYMNAGNNRINKNNVNSTN